MLRTGLDHRLRFLRRADADRVAEMDVITSYSIHYTKLYDTEMGVIRSDLDTRSEEYRANFARVQGLVADLREKVAQAALGGDENARAKHVSRGKLLPRERVRTLLDPGSPFLEIGQLAAHGMYDGDAPSAGIIRNNFV